MTKSIILTILLILTWQSAHGTPHWATINKQSHVMGGKKPSTNTPLKKINHLSLYRMPQKNDFNYPSTVYRTLKTNTPWMCIGNFNGKGPNDIAIILIEKKTNRKRLVLFEANEFLTTTTKKITYTPFLFENIAIGHNISIVTKKEKKINIVTEGTYHPSTRPSVNPYPTFDVIKMITWADPHAVHI